MDHKTHGTDRVTVLESLFGTFFGSLKRKKQRDKITRERPTKSFFGKL